MHYFRQDLMPAFAPFAYALVGGSALDGPLVLLRRNLRAFRAGETVHAVT